MGVSIIAGIVYIIRSAEETPEVEIEPIVPQAEIVLYEEPSDIIIEETPEQAEERLSKLENTYSDKPFAKILDAQTKIINNLNIKNEDSSVHDN